MTISFEAEVLLKEDSEAMTGMMGEGLKQNMTTRIYADVGPAEGDGSIPVASRVVEPSRDMTIGGQDIEIPSMDERMGEMVIRGRMSLDGRALGISVEGVEGLPQDFIESNSPSTPWMESESPWRRSAWDRPSLRQRKPIDRQGVS